MKIIKKFRPFSVPKIPKIERWLKIQSNLGYRLINYKFGVFYFKKCKKQDREYLVYIHAEKEDRFLGEFYHMKHMYGYGNRKSELNKRLLSIAEIAPERIDSSYKDFFIKRTLWYKKCYKKYLLCFGVCFLWFLYSSIFEPVISILLPILLLLVLRYATLFFIMKKQCEKMNKSKIDDE